MNLRVVLVRVLSYVSKEIGLILGVIENLLLALSQLVKALAGLASLTPSRRDDQWVNAVERILEGGIISSFHKIKRYFYR